MERAATGATGAALRLSRSSFRKLDSSAVSATFQSSAPVASAEAATVGATGDIQPVVTSKPSALDRTWMLATPALTANTRMAAMACAHTGTVFHHGAAAGTAATAGDAEGWTMVNPRSTPGGVHVASAVRTSASAANCPPQVPHCWRCCSTRPLSSRSTSS